MSVRRERSVDPSRTREEREEPGSMRLQPAVRHSRLPSKETQLSWKHGTQQGSATKNIPPSSPPPGYCILNFFFFFCTPSSATLVCLNTKYSLLRGEGMEIS